MTRRIALGAALACALLVPAAAHAGTPFTIGEGRAPHLLTDEDGTAHVTWGNSLTNAQYYCRVPRGASACASLQTLTLPAVSGVPDQAFFVRFSPSTLLIVTPISVSDEVQAWVSFDNGGSWLGPNKIYDGPPGMGNTAGEPYLESATSHVVFGAQGRQVWRTTTAGESSGTAFTTLAGVGGTDFAVAKVNGGTRTVATGNDGTATQYWVSNGSDPRVGINWPGPTTIPGELDSTRLANGPAGTFLFGSGGPSQRPEIRKLNQTFFTFGDPIALGTQTAYINDVSVGPNGVAAIWRENEPSDGNRLKFALSANGETGWAVSTIAREDVVMAEMDVALAADNAGWAVYEGSGGGTNATIRLVDTTAVAEPVPAPASASTPTPTPAPTPTPLPKRVTPKPKTVKVIANGAEITLGVPRECIPSGRPFVATLTWKKQKRKGNRFVKITRTDFYVGTKRLKIDRKAPFRQTLRIPNPKKGETYTFRARAFIKMSKGKRIPKKSITTKIKVCS